MADRELPRNPVNQVQRHGQHDIDADKEEHGSGNIIKYSRCYQNLDDPVKNQRDDNTQPELFVYILHAASLLHFLPDILAEQPGWFEDKDQDQDGERHAIAPG
ncbi:hypothetical protein D3C76_1572170 [compost metagenome]